MTKLSYFEIWGIKSWKGRRQVEDSHSLEAICLIKRFVKPTEVHIFKSDFAYQLIFLKRYLS